MVLAYAMSSLGAHVLIEKASQEARTATIRTGAATQEADRLAREQERWRDADRLGAMALRAGMTASPDLVAPSLAP
jgi:hypothetical protein